MKMYKIKSEQREISIMKRIYQNPLDIKHSSRRCWQKSKSFSRLKLQSIEKFNIALNSINIDLNNLTFIHEKEISSRVWKIDGNKRWIFPLHFFILRLCSVFSWEIIRGWEISSAQGFFNFSPRIHSSCAKRKILFKDEEYSWRFISKRFAKNEKWMNLHRKKEKNFNGYYEQMMLKWENEKINKSKKDLWDFINY